MRGVEDIDAAIERAKDGRGTEAYYREAIGDRRLLAEEVTELRDALKENQNKAEKFWRWLREARRENADLRAKGAHLAAENETLRADMVQATALGLAIRAERDALLDKIRRVEAALRDQP